MKLHERSGKSVRAFSEENGLIQSNLSRWRRELRAGVQESRRDGSLVEVCVAPAQAQSPDIGAVRVHLPGGVTMEVTDGTDAVWLAGVLRALQPVGG